MEEKRAAEIIMNITFKLLTDSHFPLMLKWLESSHVKKWWDQDIVYTKRLIKEKYGNYAQGYKLEKGKKNRIQSFIIYIDTSAIGYIQLYNSSLDFFIGESKYLGKGLGVEILKLFLSEFFNGTAISVDPDMDNIAAIKTYKKAGFKEVKKDKETKEVYMIYERY
jgi:aminoglycoside 6'-N-acetyltransferase